MSARNLVTAAILGLALAGPAGAQDAHNHGNPPAASDSPVSRAFEAANAKMHRDMAIDYTGDADVDFVRSMIPHHQGAIDMARIELEHGKDPEMRRLAEEVIKAQEAEIADMRKWLEEHGG